MDLQDQKEQEQENILEPGLDTSEEVDAEVAGEKLKIGLMDLPP